MIEALGVAMTMFLFEEIDFEVELTILIALPQSRSGSATLPTGSGLPTSAASSRRNDRIILIVFADVGGS
jgi:hypothetical protein